MGTRRSSPVDCVTSDNDKEELVSVANAKLPVASDRRRRDFPFRSFGAGFPVQKQQCKLARTAIVRIESIISNYPR